MDLLVPCARPFRVTGNNYPIWYVVELRFCLLGQKNIGGSWVPLPQILQIKILGASEKLGESNGGNGTVRFVVGASLDRDFR